MKRISLVLLTVILCVGFTGCGSKGDSEEALKNEIELLKEALNQMATTEQETTTEAITTIQETTVKIEEQIELTKEEQKAISGLKLLKSLLKKPSSMEINQIGYYYDDDTGYIDILVDITAENGFGGATRTTYKIIEDKEMSEVLGEWDNTEKIGVIESLSGNGMFIIYTDLDAKKLMENLK